MTSAPGVAVRTRVFDDAGVVVLDTGAIPGAPVDGLALLAQAGLEPRVVRSGPRRTVIHEVDGRTYQCVYGPVDLSGPASHGMVAEVEATAVHAAQRALQHALERLDHVLDATGDSAWDWDLRTDLVTYNTRWCEVAGLDPTAGLVHPLSLFDGMLHEDDADAVRARLRACVDGGGPYVSEHRLRTRGGSVIWVLDRGNVVERDADGRALRMVGSFVDIDARKASEQRNAAELIEQLRRKSRQLAASEERLRLVLKGSTDAPWDLDLIEGTLHHSDAWWSMLGRAPVAASGMDALGEFVHPADRARMRAALDAALASSSDLHEFEVRLQHADGHYVPVLSRAFVLRTDDGRPIRVSGTNTDLTARKALEGSLRLAAVAFAAQSAMVITDAAGVVLRVNPAFQQLTGYTEAELVGRPVGLLRSGRHPPEFYAAMWSTLAATGSWKGEIWNRRKNGKIYADLLTISAVVADDGETVHYVGTYADITTDRDSVAEIHRLAYYDALTRLPNRLLLHERFAQALQGAQEAADFGVLLLVDVDQFKTINDTRGHDVGDALLCELATRLKAVAGPADTVARLGGDEFVILVEHAGATQDAAEAAARGLADAVMAAVAPEFLGPEAPLRCRVCVGATILRGSCRVDELLKQVDRASHHAKRGGGNQILFFDPSMQAALDVRAALEADLAMAVERQQLRLHYQPQLDSTGRVLGVEALVRWNHPERGLVRPDQFIPLAEETGLILPIGKWVLETACEVLRLWADDPLTADLLVSVNVSARQFRQPDFVSMVTRVLDASGANPARLKLELTESVVLENVEDAIAKMLAVKRLGVSFAMDDFGTGQSSLSNLARLPLDQLKIDQSFVRILPGKQNDQTITRTIITMGRGLSMDVIAEGVETEEQRAFLEDHGCLAFQGFLFSKPAPIESVEAFVRQARRSG